MGDLIRRSDLIETLIKTREKKVELFCLHDRDELRYMHEFNMLQDVIKIVEKSPTAYDVEKVVEQEENFLVNFGIPKNTKVHREIVDIVKRGGVDVSK